MDKELPNCPFCDSRIDPQTLMHDYHANCILSSYTGTEEQWKLRPKKPKEEPKETYNLDDAEKIIKWLRGNSLSL